MVCLDPNPVLHPGSLARPPRLLDVATLAVRKPAVHDKRDVRNIDAHRQHISRGDGRDACIFEPLQRIIGFLGRFGGVHGYGRSPV